nr:UvrD-like helicase, ATP-binding domain, P-loop containing nucleoside triphosphate hydrolase [Tanacetum cinerariifolium]
MLRTGFFHEDHVENIPLSFESEHHYFGSFVYPLLEETCCELASSMQIMYRAPFDDIIAFKESKSGENMLYDVTVGPWKNQFSEDGKDAYHTLAGDLLILVDEKPESVSDLQGLGRTWAFSLVKNNEDDSTSIKVKASKPIVFQDGMFVVSVMNLTTQKRIQKSLHMHKNHNIIKKILCSDSMVNVNCNICNFSYDSILSQKLLLNLNESQRAVIMAVLCKTQCSHISSVEQIWGPPGTGKTMTVSVLLLILLQLKQKTLMYAPTNVAIVQLASRVLSLVKESYETTTLSGDCFCSVGDVVLFGNMERLKFSSDIEEIYLEHRVKRLAECLGPVTEKQLRNENEGERTILELKSFVEFVQEQFNSFAMPLRRTRSSMLFKHVCIESGFGGSLFDRLSSLGHSKHLLSVHYRMHPSISCFPNMKFYQNQIMDAQNVLSESYEKRYLSGPMFGSYSFINVVGGKEEKDNDGRSRRNIVEVAIVVKIVKRLNRAWQDSNKKTIIGVISPYAAQVVSIQEKLGHKYEKLDGFSVKVKSIDGFQGGEEDIIILSTVRSNSHVSVGFISSSQRTNVSLTRARHCLWILGNESTFANSESIWKELVSDKQRKICNNLMTWLTGIVFFLNKKNGSDEFRRSFGKLTGFLLKKQVLNLLLKLSSGWRPKNRSVDLYCEKSTQILKQFKVEGFYVICTIDIIKEVKYVQVLKVWDVLSLDEIPKLTKRLESIFCAYTDAYINWCTEKCFEGNLEVPKSWPTSEEVIRFRYLSDCEDESEVRVNARNYVENSKVSESLLLMKFYSLSRRVVSHLLSGTGKTTVLTMKLFQNEQKFRIAYEGCYKGECNQLKGTEVVDDNQDSKTSVLRQLFVSVSLKLCFDVKQNVSQLTSVSSNGNSSAVTSLDDMDVITCDFSDIPDTFINIPVKSYPLVITFHKFLMMLDGTLGNSFFERFCEAREGSHGNRISSRSVALQTFIRLREVTFDRFCSLYWPHFNSDLTKKLDPSRVFTEIISHIKGGLQAGDYSEGKLNYEDYCLLAKNRSSTLTKEKRDMVYTLFKAYEKRKCKRGEFDLGDFVNDIRHRLNNGNFEGDQMDFVYIDEVQDLSDTAQTIARGIDFRFQDIRSLFYKEFLIVGTSGKPKAPVLLESGDDDNAIATIFGGGESGAEIVGFGAEQVILVRDEHTKAEICEYVGRQALVLTIVECKGLEFQDVLLYNFFGTSPLKGQWRVLYEYMKKHNWVDKKLPQSFPTFSGERHSVLCSELKQLYVAITRTRQRLWICENKEELSKPMFDYWKLRGLVQIRKLDDSMARTMRVASSPREWRERGKKFFYENNFVLATLCFERVGDTMWVKIARGSHLRASADQMRGTNHEAFLGYVREAAEMFESIGKLEYDASCYCDLGEYERAGKIYVYTPGKIDAAAECFSLAGCHSEAAEAYAKGDQFLESCAFEYHGHDDPKSMMKFVHAFYCMESKRVFLRSLGCLDDLLLLEEESGKFLEAAELARSLDGVIKEADLLEKVGHFKEAAVLLLWYVYFSSLWGNGNSGWPLKQFPQKEVHCEKAKLLAKMESDVFCDFVSSELKVLSDQYNSLPGLQTGLDVTQKNRSLKGEIVLIRKILDKHLHLNILRYEWEDELPIDMNKHCEEMMFLNQVSIRTLVFYWNSWKEILVHLFESLRSFHNEEPDRDELYVDFSLIYFGGQKGLHMDGNRLIVDGRELVFVIRSYWQWELLTVGIKVLETLEALHKLKSNGPAFHQSTSLLHMFEVSKFLLGCQYLNLTNPYIKKLQCLLRISLTYFDLVFPLDWRKSVSKDLISLRETELSVNLLDEIILHYVDMKGDFTYWKIGRVMMICLGSKTSAALYDQIIKKLEGNPTWNQLEAWRLHFTGQFCASFGSSSFRTIFYMKPSTLLGLLLLDGLHIFTLLLLTKLFPDKKHEFSPFLILFYVDVVNKILYVGKDTITWLQRSDIKENYLPILAVKLVMMLCSIFLDASECSKVLLNLLSDHRRWFPNKFMSNLLRGKKGQDLILNPEMVAEAFSSIEDPLVVVYYGDARPDIHAPCAIFVDLRNSREEIMSLLFQRKTTLSVENPVEGDACGLIPEITCANMSAEAYLNPVGKCRGELRMKCKDLTKIYKFLKGKMPITLKNEIEIYVDALGIALEDGKFHTGEYISVVHDLFSEAKALLDVFKTSQTPSVSRKILKI